jgi:hypothetical protein
MDNCPSQENPTQQASTRNTREANLLTVGNLVYGSFPKYSFGRSSRTLALPSHLVSVDGRSDRGRPLKCFSTYDCIVRRSRREFTTRWQKKEILLTQQSAVNEYERYQQSNATARQELPPQKIDAGAMRMMNNALWIPERAVELQLRLCVEAHCRSAGHRAYEETLRAIKEYVA